MAIDPAVLQLRGDVDDLQRRVLALEQRDTLIVQGEERTIEGHYQGASGAAGDVVALEGGVDTVSGQVLPDPKR